MQNVVIFGAGQSGRMIKKLLKGTCEQVTYADNNYKNLPHSIDGIHVISPKQIPNLNPDKIIVTVLNKEAAEDIYGQLIEYGVSQSSILNINHLRELFDIRLSVLRLQAEEINKRDIEGNIAELGVYKGYIAKELNILFKKRRLYLFDTFTGFDERDIECERLIGKNKSLSNDFSDTSIDQVKSVLPYPEMVTFCKGYFPDSAKNIEEEKFAFVSLDSDLYLPTYNGLEYFYPRLTKGGSILLHDYNSAQFPNVKKAVDDFSEKSDIKVIPLCDLHGSAVIV